MRSFLSGIVLVLLLVGVSYPVFKPYVSDNPGNTDTPRLSLPTKVNPLDGSVIFWKGGLLVGPIYRNTGTSITHAAILLYDDKGQPWVYEAVPPVVRRLKLSEYLKEMQIKETEGRSSRKGFEWFALQPASPYTYTQLLTMKKHASEQLGRPYMLRGWWQGREVRGIFCSQYVGNIIEKSGLIESGNFTESPGSLLKKLTPSYTTVKLK